MMHENIRNQHSSTTWDIRVLDYGICKLKSATVHLPNATYEGEVDMPFLGFLLESNGHYVLVDTGVDMSFEESTRYIKTGGYEYLLNALEKNGVSPEMIEVVLYTHLHYDHVGGCMFFPNATHIVQKAEWEGMLHPIPVQQARADYDPRTPARLSANTLLLVDGDQEVLPGISVYRAGGHSVGGQFVAVDTPRGKKVLAGDVCVFWCTGFPDQVDHIVDLNGQRVDAKPDPIYDKVAILSSVTTDQFAYYDSLHKLRILAQNKWQNVYPGHEPGLLKMYLNEDIV